MHIRWSFASSGTPDKSQDNLCSFLCNYFYVYGVSSISPAEQRKCLTTGISHCIVVSDFSENYSKCLICWFFHSSSRHCGDSASAFVRYREPSNVFQMVILICVRQRDTHIKDRIKKTMKFIENECNNRKWESKFQNSCGSIIINE